jgi:PAS domain S-box-containing protein
MTDHIGVFKIMVMHRELTRDRNGVKPYTSFLKHINRTQSLYPISEPRKLQIKATPGRENGMIKTKILIVEDEGVAALSLQSILTKMGYGVVGIAITGMEAIKMARDLKPDVILMDIHLKGEMDGIQTTEKINEFSDLPVIFLTAYADDETVKRALTTKSHSFLVKPYNPREIYSNIEFAIYKHRLKHRVGSHQEHLELLLTKLSVAGIIIDIKGTIVYANPAAEVLAGYRIEEMKNSNAFDLLDITVSQTGNVIDENLSRILALGAIHYLPAIASLQTKSGKRRTVSLRTGLIRDDTTDPRYIFILLNEHNISNLGLKTE